MSNEPSNGEMAVFIQLVSKAIESNASLSTKTDLIAQTQNKQDDKLDKLGTTLTELKTMSSNLNQSVAEIAKDITDHEIRVRKLEEITSRSEDRQRRVEEVERKLEIHNIRIDKIETDQTRNSVIIGAILLTANVILVGFVIPWIQQILFGG